MPKDNVPQKDSALLPWAQNLSTRVSATPTAFGATAAMATELASRFSAFSTALAAATNPATRGGSTILTKKTAKANLIAYCRVVARQIQGTNFVTDQQRFDLGLTIRAQPQVIPVPGVAPLMDIDKVNVKTVTVKIHNADTTKRGKPAGCAGASVYSFVGDAPPDDINKWVFEGNTTKVKFAVEFTGSIVPFARVWLACAWFNPRQQVGPACTPITTNLGSWMVQDVPAEAG